MINISATNLHNSGINIPVDLLPDRCPLCHMTCEPHPKTSYIRTIDGKSILECVFHCRNSKCQRFFISEYVNNNIKSNLYFFSRSYPSNFKKSDLPVLVSKNFTAFVSIFNQAIHAEQTGLDEISGVGFRKSLEFLVKDFAILRNPAEAETIKKLLLSPCINKYISDIRIKQNAERAAWLGNDETHYVRKWETKDITDLKKLINIVVHYIEMDLAHEQYEKEMPKP